MYNADAFVLMNFIRANIYNELMKCLYTCKYMYNVIRTHVLYMRGKVLTKFKQSEYYNQYNISYSSLWTGLKERALNMYTCRIERIYTCELEYVNIIITGCSYTCKNMYNVYTNKCFVHTEKGVSLNECSRHIINTIFYIVLIRASIKN